MTAFVDLKSVAKRPKEPRGKADKHLGVGHLAASPEGTRRRSKGHQEWWQPVVSGLAGRPPRSDATISSGDSATPIVLLERHSASQPGAAPAAGTRTTSGRCRWSSDPPHAGERTDQRLLAAGDLTRRIWRAPRVVGCQSCLSAWRHTLMGAERRKRWLDQGPNRECDGEHVSLRVSYRGCSPSIADITSSCDE